MFWTVARSEAGEFVLSGLVMCAVLLNGVAGCVDQFDGSKV